MAMSKARRQAQRKNRSARRRRLHASAPHNGGQFFQSLITKKINIRDLKYWFKRERHDIYEETVTRLDPKPPRNRTRLWPEPFTPPGETKSTYKTLHKLNKRRQITAFKSLDTAAKTAKLVEFRRKYGSLEDKSRRVEGDGDVDGDEMSGIEEAEEELLKVWDGEEVSESEDEGNEGGVALAGGEDGKGGNEESEDRGAYRPPPPLTLRRHATNNWKGPGYESPRASPNPIDNSSLTIRQHPSNHWPTMVEGEEEQWDEEDEL